MPFVPTPARAASSELEIDPGRRRVFPRLVSAALIFGSWGCSDPDRGWITTYQLERSAGLADVPQTGTVLDLGTENARPSLGAGWSWNESNSVGETFVWSNGSPSVLEFLVLNVGEGAILELTGLPFSAPDAPDATNQEVTVRSRDLDLAVLEVGEAIRTYRVPLEEGVLRPGWNEFELDYRWTRADLASQKELRWQRNQRDLAVAWMSAQLLQTDGTPLVPPRPPSVKPDLIRQTLELGEGTMMVFELELAPGSRFKSEIRCAGCNQDEPVLDLLAIARDEGGDAAAIARMPAVALQPGNNVVDLGVERFETHLLILRARDSGHSETGATVVLAQPRLQRPVPAAEH